MRCTLDVLLSYLEESSSPEEYNLVLNDKSEVLEIHCNLTDLNNYVYDKLTPLCYKKQRKDKSPYSYNEHNESMALRLAEWGIGNCSDLCEAASALLAHYPHEGFKKLLLPSLDLPVLVEVLTLNEDDHEFVVINRRSGSTLNDPTTWGKDVVILDCWLKECYLLEEVLSGARDSISAQLIFNKPAYEIEGANSIGEGASAHWKGKYSAKDIFSLKTRSWGSEEHVPWVKPSARNALSAPSV